MFLKLINKRNKCDKSFCLNFDLNFDFICDFRVSGLLFNNNCWKHGFYRLFYLYANFSLGSIVHQVFIYFRLDYGNNLLRTCGVKLQNKHHLFLKVYLGRNKGNPQDSKKDYKKIISVTSYWLTTHVFLKYTSKLSFILHCFIFHSIVLFQKRVQG